MNRLVGLYECKRIRNAGMPGFNDVEFGLQFAQVSITIKSTSAYFVEGQQYMVQITEFKEVQ